MNTAEVRRQTRFAPILRQMRKNPTKTAVYQLIAAGQMARAALVRPLTVMGLEQGDDALIFALKRDKALADTDLSELTGLEMPLLLPRLERLIRLDLIVRMEAGGSRLTEKGTELRKQLARQWQEMDEALLGEFKPKHQKRLKRMLTRFATLLDF